MSYDFFAERTVTARKTYRCIEGSCEIRPGERYSYGAGKFEGEMIVQRLCLDCRLLANEFVCTLGYDDGWPVGEIRALLRDRHGVTSDPIEWARKARDQRIPREAAQEIARQALAAHQPILREISQERRGQITVHGWSPWHDDTHSDASLARAASAFALAGCGDLGGFEGEWPIAWGTLPAPPASRRRALVIAAALIVAELERLDRASVLAA